MHRPGSFSGALRILATMIGDALLTWASLLLIVTVRAHVDIPLTQALMPPGKFPLDAWNLMVFAGSAIVALALSGHYDFRPSPRHHPSLFLALPLQMALVAVMGTLLTRSWPRTVFIAVPFLEAGAFTIWRLVLARLWHQRPRTTVLVGDAATIDRFLPGMPEWMKLIGIVSTDRPMDDPRWTGVLGDAKSDDVIRGADEVIDIGAGASTARRLDLLALRGPRGYLFAPSVADALVSDASFAALGPHILAKVSMPGAYGIGALVKRLFDLLAGILLFVVSLPLLLLSAAAVAVEGRGKILLRQERAGLNGRPFLMWKLRTMRVGESSLDSASDDDQRVTPAGRWLRRYRLDELPQLLNVLSGDMSLVGPRPEFPERTREISATLPHFALRLLVRPGVAGLAQTSAEYDQSPAVKLTYDLQYLCSWSAGRDVAILVRALVTVLSGRGI